MIVRGYVNKGKHFCVEHFRPNAGDEPLEDVPEDATYNRCFRPLLEVAMSEGRA